MSAALTVEPYASARQWLLGRLQEGPIACLELRHSCAASANPAERVRELRLAGHDIGTMYCQGEYWYLLCVDGQPCWGTEFDLREQFALGKYRWGVHGRPACL